jgi:hypothetical protein
MAPRKDTMRIIRQDAGFSAKLGFGGQVAQATNARNDQALHVDAAVEADSPSADLTETPAESTTLPREPEIPARAPVEDAARETRVASTRPSATASSTGSPARGQVVYVAVSLTARQAIQAESWASAARCSVQFLIRYVAQGLREEVFDEWAQKGMPEVEEPRGSRGKHPTSVTMTLRPEFAADLAARYDPLGVLGLARVMGPAFRARFEAAFDAALATARRQSGDEGDDT